MDRMHFFLSCPLKGILYRKTVLVCGSLATTVLVVALSGVIVCVKRKLQRWFAARKNNVYEDAKLLLRRNTYKIYEEIDFYERVGRNEAIREALSGGYTGLIPDPDVYEEIYPTGAVDRVLYVHHRHASFASYDDIRLPESAESLSKVYIEPYATEEIGSVKSDGQLYQPYYLTMLSSITGTVRKVPVKSQSVDCIQNIKKILKTSINTATSLPTRLADMITKERKSNAGENKNGRTRNSTIDGTAKQSKGYNGNKNASCATMCDVARHSQVCDEDIKTRYVTNDDMIKNRQNSDENMSTRDVTDDTKKNRQGCGKDTSTNDAPSDDIMKLRQSGSEDASARDVTSNDLKKSRRSCNEEISAQNVTRNGVMRQDLGCNKDMSNGDETTNGEMRQGPGCNKDISNGDETSNGEMRQGPGFNKDMSNGDETRNDVTRQGLACNKDMSNGNVTSTGRMGPSQRCNTDIITREKTNNAMKEFRQGYLDEMGAEDAKSNGVKGHQQRGTDGKITEMATSSSGATSRGPKQRYQGNKDKNIEDQEKKSQCSCPDDLKKMLNDEFGPDIGSQY